MHDNVRHFVTEVRRRHPEYFRNCRVLEIGSYNINGTVRDFFHDCVYLGIDWRDGPGVDRVCIAHELELDANTFDVVVSTEVLEHDRFKVLTVQTMLRMLRPRGLFMLTCAGPERPTHEVDCGIAGHYENVPLDFFDQFVEEFGHHERQYTQGRNDVQIYGIKHDHLPSSVSAHQLRNR